jgi:hypothetical protein
MGYKPHILELDSKWMCVKVKPFPTLSTPRKWLPATIGEPQNDYGCGDEETNS